MTPSSKKHESYRTKMREVFLRYSSLSEGILDQLWALAQVRKLAKGEVLLPIGKTAKALHILCEGAIITYYTGEEGDTYHKNIFLEGDFVASTVSLLRGSPSEFTLKAIEESTIISFNYQKYRALIGQYDELKDLYIAYLEKNWVIDKEKREVALVMKNATVRYLEFIAQHPGIEQRIPLHYIASNLGITPTQLSRIRKSLEG